VGTELLTANTTAKGKVAVPEGTRPDRPEGAHSGPFRVAVIGCGAVAQAYHLPVLAGHPWVRVVALVDPNREAAGRLAKAYGVDQAVSDVGAIDPRSVDAAVIATPPFHHAPAALELLRRGIHVFVEKPMALNGEDAAAMVDAAEEAGAVLAVGHFRRLFPASRMLAAMVTGEVFGRPVGFQVEEGNVFDWPLMSLGSMRKELAGGGVLIDTGSHTLDQLLFFFAGAAELVEFRSNSLGGIESDCRLRLRLFHHGEPVEGAVELSRTRKLRNTFRITCERATLELPVGEHYRVAVTPRGDSLADPASGAPREYNLQAGWIETPQPGSHKAYRAEIDDWLSAIQAGARPFLSGLSALPTVQLIDECYRSARPLLEPWVQEGFREGPVREETAVRAGDEPAPASPGIQVRKSSPPRRVLVTGAAGFIGCRVAELLKFREGWEVRALVHNPGSASRLARLPVEMVRGDLRSKTDMARVVEGCDAVVHCAYGTSWERREMFDVTVGGAQVLAEAARAAGLGRFVHLSTMAIHGRRVEGVVDEATPVRPARNDAYAESKAEAERVIDQAARRGLSAVTLRLACVFGPFSRAYVIRPVEHLLKGVPVLVGQGETPSNTVYVDSVVDAITRALKAPGEAVDRQTFTIGDADGVSWADYHGWFARALEVEMRAVPSEEVERQRAKQRSLGVVRWIGSWFLALKAIATSSELIALGQKVLQTDPVGRLPRGLFTRFPWLKERMRGLLKLNRPFVYRGPEASPPPPPPLELLELYAYPARVSSEKARRVLGYTPVPRGRAMQLTLNWLQYAGYLKKLTPISDFADFA
jgi:predicted dehydrogenase/nucleoside-diphosphate-sugar epimerase